MTSLSKATTQSKNSDRKQEKFEKQILVKFQQLAIREQNLRDMLSDITMFAGMRLGIEAHILSAQKAHKSNETEDEVKRRMEIVQALAGDQDNLDKELKTLIQRAWLNAATMDTCTKRSECQPLIKSISALLAGASLRADCPSMSAVDMQPFFDNLAAALNVLVENSAYAIFKKSNALLNEMYEKGKVFYFDEKKKKKKTVFTGFWATNLPKNQKKRFGDLTLPAAGRIRARIEHIFTLVSNKKKGGLAKYIKDEISFVKAAQTKLTKQLDEYDKVVVARLKAQLVGRGFRQQKDAAAEARAKLMDEKRMGGDDIESDWMSDKIDQKIV